ncbi:MAG TPA: galactosyltransferase-related protein [Chitinophaga sp.]|uniref:galactosyltransferase-related protein n=1 Tax=Chitinophaga sp. TaxID=1869181 RepID=UPI002CA0B39E|nr:galactosyltransferase-related protein [Chitinophaga sp.]HVI49409.1 galactosyltransferase-related protein [Chitinophaga sp.]
MDQLIYLSAQPDDYYFLWQLELQLHNFNKLEIPRENIHVLIGYNPEKGISREFEDFVAINDCATFFTYPDNRKDKTYIPSIRPHIIRQHFLAVEGLSSVPLFYLDSDVLFREKIPLGTLLQDDTWYLSDTRNYLDSAYVISKAGRAIFEGMCRIAGVDPGRVIAQDKQAGGAQYILKNTSADFWGKVERDSESIYRLLNEYNASQSEAYYLETGNPMSQYQGIQAWCADMWAILYNGIARNVDVKIHPLLDFCWPYDSIDRWEQHYILHYAGVTDTDNSTLFCKTKYIHYPPYYDDFRHIDSNSCSNIIIHMMNDLKCSKAADKINLDDVTFLIPVRIDSPDRKENLLSIINYLDKYFHTRMIILEADTIQQLADITFPAGCRYVFYKDDHPVLKRTHYNNIMVASAETPIISIYDTDVVFPVMQIQLAVEQIRNGSGDFVSPYDGVFLNIDKLFKQIFCKILDPDVLTQNINKFFTSTQRSFGGAVLLNKAAFIAAGMDNENIYGWGPEDVERRKRMEILGYKISRISGPLFHLDHQRGLNSGYPDTESRMELMEEYLGICHMNREEMERYIADHFNRS